MGDETNWLGLFSEGRYQRFVSAFDVEVRRYGVATVSAYTHHNDRVPEGAPWVGQRQVSALVHSLGKRYLGTLVVSPVGREQDLPGWLTDMCRFGRPVVWFDRHGRAPEDYQLHPLLTRCHQSEEAMVRVCIDHLVERGHTHAWFPSVGGRRDWLISRFQSLVGYGRKQGIEVELLEVERGGSGEAHDDPERLTSWGRMAMRRHRTVTPVMRAVLSRDKAPTIISPHDYTAYNVYNWCARERVPIPRRVSLISFDNSPRTGLVPVTSIDFGLGFLGYAAFHVLFGMIRMRRTDDGRITARPFVVDRGSVGRAVPQ
jgi:DNA-binding LacI/PurR family transcriptional regulator